MARIKTKDLKTQYMIRVYNQDEYEIFKRALEKFKDKFDSLNDAMKYFALLGADKMLGDNTLNQSINFSEIRKNLQEINDKLTTISANQKMDFVDTNANVRVNQALLNLITKLLNKQSPINLNVYSQGWKYDPLDENGIEGERDRILRELIDVR